MTSIYTSIESVQLGQVSGIQNSGSFLFLCDTNVPY